MTDITMFGASPCAPASINDMAIQAAIDCQSGGGIVAIPEGTFEITNIDVCQRGVELRGASRYSSVLKSTVPTGDVVTLSAWDTAIKSLSIVSDTFRTSGANLVLSGVRSIAEDILINKDMVGIKMSGTASRILRCFLQTGAANSTRIDVSGGDTSQIISDCLIGAQNAPMPYAGIVVHNSCALVIDNTSVLTAGRALLINPGAGEIVSSLKASNCFFDSSTVGALIRPAGGSASRLDFTNCWFGNSSSNGVSINNSGSGLCEGISFNNCDFLRNANVGIDLGNCRGITFTGGRIAHNDHGVYFTSGVSDVGISNMQIGMHAGETANTGWGIVLAPDSNLYAIFGNRIIGNGYGTITGHSASAYKVAANNIG
jgi:hypothetical protein